MTSPSAPRLDQVLVARGLAPTRAKAQALVLAGRVWSGQRRLEKPGLRIPSDTELRVVEGPRWVSRGGDKLEGALDAFGIATDGVDALDVGASTGGFTQVLLQRGCPRVIALDVGRGQLDWGLRQDPRVHVLEGVNARHLKPSDLPFSPRLVVVDVSFISVEKILPATIECLAPGGEIVSLLKPQFEVGRGKVGRGGIVRDPADHRAVLERIVGHAAAASWGVVRVCRSPIRGAQGNREFFAWLRPGTDGSDSDALAADIARAVAAEGEP